MTNKTVKTALVGAGRIAFKLEKDTLRSKPCTHLGALVEINKVNEKFNIIGVCDLLKTNSNEAADFIAAGNAKPLISKDYKDIIKLHPDLLIIASTTNSHYEILMRAIHEGISNIVCEKPICLNKQEALKIYEKASNHGIQIWVNYERRFHPKYIYIKSIIDDKQAYGKILSYTAQFFTPQTKMHGDRDDEGVLLHDTTHLLDLAYYLFGAPVEEKRKENKSIITTENNISHTMLISHKNSTNGILRTLLGSDYFHFEMELLFEKARIRVGNGFYSVETGEHSPLYEGFISLKKPVYIDKEPKNIVDNPFIRLYTDVYENKYNKAALKDACQNVMRLSINSSTS